MSKVDTTWANATNNVNQAMLSLISCIEKAIKNLNERVVVEYARLTEMRNR